MQNISSNRKLECKQLFTYIFLLYSLLLVLQNPLAMMMTNLSDNIAKSILGLKDGILLSSITLYIIYLLYAGKTTLQNIILITIILIIIILSLAKGNVSLLSIRQLLIIPIGLLFGNLLYTTKVNINLIFKTYIYIMVLLVVFGYFERFILYDEHESFWNLLGIQQYMAMKGLSKWANEYTHVSNSFYSFDFYNYINDKFRRMVSIIAEPTLLGQLLIFPSLYYIFRKQYFLALFFLIPIFLAFSKGGLLGVFIGTLLYIWQKKSTNFSRFIILIMVSCITIAVSFLYINNSVQSITNHLNGFLSNFSILLEHPFGLGIGSAGNYYNINAAGENITAGESYVGAIVGQFGILGLFLYLILFKSIYRTKPNGNVMLITIKYSMLATLATGFFSESAISYVGTSLLIILTAYLLNNKIMEPISL